MLGDNMKSLTDLGLGKNGSFELNSNLTGFGLDFGAALSKSNYDLGLSISEYSLSYYNLRRIALTSYGRIAHSYFNILEGKREPYEVLESMSEFCHLFIISAKSSLDIAVSLIDIIITKEKKDDSRLPDLIGYKSKEDKINFYLEKVRNLDWVNDLILIRNRIVHRGFTIRFFESEENGKITIPYIVRQNLSWTGRKDMTSDGFENDGRGNIRLRINLEKIIEGYINDIFSWEKQISDTFLDERLVSEIDNYEILKSDFGGFGVGFVFHRSVGEF